MTRFREVLRRWWHRWIVADDETSALHDRWDREARGHINPNKPCPFCEVSPKRYIRAQEDGACADCSWEQWHERTEP